MIGIKKDIQELSKNMQELTAAVRELIKANKADAPEETGADEQALGQVPDALKEELSDEQVLAEFFKNAYKDGDAYPAAYYAYDENYSCKLHKMWVGDLSSYEEMSARSRRKIKKAVSNLIKDQGEAEMFKAKWLTQYRKSSGRPFRDIDELPDTLLFLFRVTLMKYFNIKITPYDFDEGDTQ